MSFSKHGRGLLPRACAIIAAAAAITLLLLGVALAVDVRNDEVVASFDGRVSPRALPRDGAVPVALHMRGSVRAVDLENPPKLERVTIAINRHGTVTTKGLPLCRVNQIRNTTTRQALNRCRPSVVGGGSFTAHIRIPELAPFPAAGRLIAFNGRFRGRHALLAHIFGTEPVPTSNVLALVFQRPESRAFGTTLSTELPDVASRWGYVTGFKMTLKRRYRHRGRVRSVISAGCPAPEPFRRAQFPAAKGTYQLSDGRKLSRILRSSCRVRG